MTLEHKWGFDGSSGQSNYKQKFESDPTIDDSSIVINSIVPLKLTMNGPPEKVIWYNVKSSSTRHCRPLRLQFEKETEPFSMEEIQNLKETIIEITPTLQVKITHCLSCSMIDGKVCSALTGNCFVIHIFFFFFLITPGLPFFVGISTQRCVVCGAYPREMNNLEVISTKKVDEATFEFGLSPLHAYIR